MKHTNSCPNKNSINSIASPRDKIAPKNSINSPQVNDFSFFEPIMEKKKSYQPEPIYQDIVLRSLDFSFEKGSQVKMPPIEVPKILFDHNPSSGMMSIKESFEATAQFKIHSNQLRSIDHKKSIENMQSLEGPRIIFNSVKTSKRIQSKPDVI